MSASSPSTTSAPPINSDDFDTMDRSAYVGRTFAASVDGGFDDGQFLTIRFGNTTFKGMLFTQPVAVQVQSVAPAALPPAPSVEPLNDEAQESHS